MDSPKKSIDRVLYVAKFAAPTAVHGAYEHAVAHAFEQNGVRCLKCDYRKYAKLRTIARDVKSMGIKYLLFSKAEPRYMRNLVPWAKGNGITTIAWMWDLYWGYRRSRPCQFCSDYLFTTDGGHDKQWQSIGANHQVLRQGIHEPEYQMLQATEYKHDVAFVGSVHYPERKQLVSWLRKTYGGRFVHYTRTRGMSLNWELARVKVVVGDSYPVPRYWSNRIYEVIGRGGFFLHPQTEGMSDEWQDGTHYVSYMRGNYRYLKELIDYYVAHDKEREAIRQAGWRQCAQYTYTQRVKQLLEYVSG